MDDKEIKTVVALVPNFGLAAAKSLLEFADEVKDKTSFDFSLDMVIELATLIRDAGEESMSNTMVPANIIVLSALDEIFNSCSVPTERRIQIRYLLKKKYDIAE